jgi:3-dehydroquinate synthase
MNPTIDLKTSLSYQSQIFIEKGLYKNLLNIYKNGFWFYDENLPESLLNPLKETISNDQRFGLPEGEKSKSFQTLKAMIDFLDQKDLTKDSVIIALGGGAISDSVGLLSSIYMRGLHFIILPTTLLSMVDASVGGKTAMNTHSKNRIGTFYPAHEIYIDLDFIDSMPKALIEDGFSEIIKMAVTFDLTLTQGLENQSLTLAEIIKKAIEIKSSVVEKDLTDSKERKLLNFGHTMGHALEKYHNYKYSHGKAVASGMLLEIDDQELKDRVKKLLIQYGCLTDIPFNSKDLMVWIKNDKKRSKDSITWIQLNAIGKASLKEISLDSIIQRLNQ